MMAPSVLSAIKLPLEGWLLAQRSNWSRMGDRFSGSAAKLETSEIIGLVALAVGAGALIWLLHWLANQEENWFKQPSPKRLFRELCRTHQLKRREIRLLRSIAQQAALEHPVELFLRPDLVQDEGLAKELFGDLNKTQTSNPKPENPNKETAPAPPLAIR